MLMNISLSLFVLLFLSTKSLTTTATTTAATTTALDDYVWKHDDNYNWVEMPQYGMKMKNIEMLCKDISTLFIEDKFILLHNHHHHHHHHYDH
jgi:hypothetical protein